MCLMVWQDLGSCRMALLVLCLGVLNDKGINTTCSWLELCFSVLDKNLSLDFSQKFFYVLKLFLEGSC